MWYTHYLCCFVALQISYDASEPSNSVAHGADDSILPDSRIIHRANERLIHEGRPIFVYVGIDIGLSEHVIDMVVIDFADGSYGDSHDHSNDGHDDGDDFGDDSENFQSAFHNDTSKYLNEVSRSVSSFLLH